MPDMQPSRIVDIVLSALSQLDVTGRIRKSREYICGGGYGDISRGKLCLTAANVDESDTEAVVVAIKSI